jgi:hypothetical protein
MDTNNEGTLNDFGGNLLTSVQPTLVDIRLGNATIKAELQIDGNLFAVSACGGLPNGLVAFGRTVQEACDNFVVSCINHSVKSFGQFKE